MTSNYRSITSLPLEALESMNFACLERDEVERLKLHAWGMAFEIDCDDWAATKGLMPLARRWRKVQSRANQELETRFEGEGV
jgi:hypothetical protein